MSVVVNPPAGANHGHGMTAQIIFADVVDKASGGRINRGSPRREDVLSLVLTNNSSRSMPGISDLFLADVLERHGYLGIWIFSVQPSDPHEEQELITNLFCSGGKGQNHEHKQYGGSGDRDFLHGLSM